MMAGMTEKNGKTPSESAVVTRYLVMPQQANPQGTAFGGAIMAKGMTVFLLIHKKLLRHITKI